MNVLIQQVTDRPPAAPPRRVRHVAYIMSRFPKITETFVLFEMQQIERLGLKVDVYPLQRERTAVTHPEAAPYVARAHFAPWFTWAMLLASFHFLFRKPRTYSHTIWTLLRANWGSWRYLGGAVLFFPKAVWFARCMQQSGVQHVHAHFASHPAAVAYVIHRLTGLPYSFTAHGSDLHRDRHMLREKVAASAAVVAISRYNRRIILDECGPGAADKVHVVHCGVDSQKFTGQQDVARDKRHPHPFRVVCVGTLHAVKGQRYLIEACRLLQDMETDFECHFIGDGPDELELRTLVDAHRLTESFHFHGRQPANEVRRVLRESDVLAAPSVPTPDGRREGIPVVLMEALAAGVPVVASDLSGIPELVIDGETGLLTPPGDSTAIAGALLRLARDPSLRMELAELGRSKVEREFNLTTNTAALADIFNSVPTAC
jgi:glycosyltransferase involved in cell wall biosynthesis